MTKVTDEQAWQLAIEMLRVLGEPIEVNAVRRMLEDDGLEAAGRYAAHAMQFRTLRSKPWLALPCDLNDAAVEQILAAGDSADGHGRYAAAVLARRLRHAGVSRWHPDPMTALREAERDTAA
jgi:hypothetical protein